MTGELIDARSGRVLVERVERARGLGRTIGLLGRRVLDYDDGLWFDRCGAVHTIGMRIPIDIVFLDEEGCVVRADENVPPWRPVVSARGARATLELAAGCCRRIGIAPGQVLEMRWDSSTPS